MNTRLPPPKTRQEKKALRRAVALAYKPLNADDAPRVVTKGEGSIADAILQQAEKYNIPVLRNPELSELLADVETGSEVPTEAFLAVAEVLRYVYALRGEDPPLATSLATPLSQKQR